MTYIKQTWVDAPVTTSPITAARLNYIEEGVETAQETSDAKYTKPGGGIPSTDLATTVQTSIGKADTALQTVTKADVGLSAVNNTSDSSKPVSAAQQAALDGKADAVKLAGPPRAVDVMQGLYARTIPAPSGEATIRALCADPNNAGYLWAFGATSAKIGYTTNHGGTFVAVVSLPAAGIQQAKITTNFMWLLCANGTSKNGTLWRSPAPNATGSNLAFTKIFDLSVDAPFVFNASFRETSFDILPDESKAYLLTYGGGNDAVAIGGASDGIMTAGSDYLFSASGGAYFSGIIQGANITVTGAGASGATLTTTVAEVYSPTLIRLTNAAQTTVSAATYNFPSQTFGALNVFGGPRLYRSDNVNTATPASVTFTQAYNGWNFGRHGHTVKVIGGVPWVSIGDYNYPKGTRYNWPPLTHTGLYAATDNTGTAFNIKVPTTITSPHVFLNFMPIALGGQNVIVGESDDPFAGGPLFCPTQSNVVGSFVAISPMSPTAPPQVTTMRALTITPEGNLMWLGTGESGVIGPVDCIMTAKAPFTVPVVLEQMALDTIAFPQLAIQDGAYVWIGTHRIAMDKFIGQ